MLVIGRLASVDARFHLIRFARGNQIGVFAVLLCIKLGFLHALGSGIIVQDNCLLPNLPRPRNGPKRRLHGGCKQRPKCQEAQNRHQRHPKQTPKIAQMGFGRVTCEYFHNWRQPWQPHDLEPPIQRVDKGKSSRASGVVGITTDLAWVDGSQGASSEMQVSRHICAAI